MAGYTGTGTETDPWIVSDWETYRSLDIQNHLGYYIKWASTDDNTIDFNTVKPDGYDGVFDVYCNVDFNDWTFRNLRVNPETRGVFSFPYYTSGSMYRHLYFKNANFENVYTNSTSFVMARHAPDQKRTIDNISVTGRIGEKGYVILVDGGADTFGPESLIVRRCSFVTEVGPNATDIACVRNGKVQLNYFKVLYQGNGTYRAGLGTLSNNCLYILRGNNVISKTTESSVVGYYTVVGSSVTDVFRFECPTTIINDVGVSYTSSLINNETTSITSDIPDGVFSCTSDQMKDVEYLREIGFPIGAV